MEKITFKLTSDGSALLMRSGDLANPLNPFTRKLASLVEDKKKKDADELALLTQIAHTEFEGGLYYDKDLGPYLPTNVIRASLIKGAKMHKGGASVQRSVQAIGQRAALQYDGPRDIDALWADPAHVHQAVVKIGQAKVLRTRPLFANWSCTATFLYIPSGKVTADNLLRWMEDAGRFHGVGDNRVNGFGRFNVEVLSQRQAAAAK